MSDILSQGGDREPGRWPRRLAAAALVGLAAAVLGWLLPRHPPGRATLGPVPVAVSGSVAVGLAGQADGIAGQGLPWEGSLRLPLTGIRPAWFWPGTGRTRPIGGLPPDPAGYQFIRVGGGWAVQADAAARPGCGGCPGPALPVYYLAAGARSVTRIGMADQVAPAATAGAVWLTSYPPAAELSTAAGTAREVSVTGAPLGPRASLPRGYLIEQGTVRGLLLAPVLAGPGTADKLWNPARQKAGRMIAGVIAASATQVAWRLPCDPLCRVQVLDLATGRHAVARLPRGSSVASGAFSPSGGFLALQVSFPSIGDDGALAMQLQVASAASGRLAAVPGTWVSSDALIGFGWPAAGDTLVGEFGFTTKVQVASWHPGASRLAVTVIRLGARQDSLVTG